MLSFANFHYPAALALTVTVYAMVPYLKRNNPSRDLSLLPTET